MDTEGIDTAVLFPTRGLGILTFPDQDPRFAAAMARAYNDWLHDFCKTDPNRLLGAGMISVYDIDDALRETRRVVEEYGFCARISSMARTGTILTTSRCGTCSKNLIYRSVSTRRPRRARANARKISSRTSACAGFTRNRSSRCSASAAFLAAAFSSVIRK